MESTTYGSAPVMQVSTHPPRYQEHPYFHTNWQHNTHFVNGHHQMHSSNADQSIYTSHLHFAHISEAQKIGKPVDHINSLTVATSQASQFPGVDPFTAAPASPLTTEDQQHEALLRQLGTHHAIYFALTHPEEGSLDAQSQEYFIDNQDRSLRRKDQDATLATRSNRVARVQSMFHSYMMRQRTLLSHQGHRAIVENVHIYLEGLKVTYREKDISIVYHLNISGSMTPVSGMDPKDAYKDNLSLDISKQRTSSFIFNSVCNFLHSGSLGNLCMLETVSTYFIPMCLKTASLGSSFAQMNVGYAPGTCGKLTIYSDGTYKLKAFGIIVVLGADFVAFSMRHVLLDRRYTSSIRLLHPRGYYALPEHVLSYHNRPLYAELPLPNSQVGDLIDVFARRF